jgi:DNA polymerase III alpha subunit
MSYSPLLYHSNYGFGGSDFKTLFELLKRFDLETCGIIDETFFGLIEFTRYARAYGIRPITGARIPVAALSKGPAASKDHIYLLAMDQNGYSNICQILTRKAFGTLGMEFVKEHAKGTILLSRSLPLLKEMRDAFSQIFYLLLPGHDVISPDFPPVAANEIFYADLAGRRTCKLLSVIKKYPYECSRGKPHRLLTCEEFLKNYAGYPAAVKNNRLAADMCAFVPENRGWIFPASTSNLHEIIRPHLRRLSRVQKTRVAYEFKVIKKMGFEPYFTLVYDLKEFARVKGIGMNVRGSAASSLILHILGLSIADPIRNNLPFERFLNPMRTEPPDIDVDVEFNQREKLIREIYGKFGIERVAHIGVVNHFQRRARFRDTARAYGMTPLELKNLDNHAGEKLLENILEISQRIDGYPHYFSCHPSGIIITPADVDQYVPLSPSPAGRITHFDKDGIEAIGLVKLDILGVRGFPGLFLEKEKVDFNDRRVFDFIAGCKTLGCFQIESPAVRQALQRIAPRTLTDIANAIAIIRPGPAQGGMKELFMRRLRDGEKVQHLHPALEKTLEDTLGVPVYQEQILQMAHDFAGFSLSEGDVLRRAMTKDRDSLKMIELRELFFLRAAAKGHPQSDIERIWDRIAAFSSFGFNKSHSITYATLAYLSAYQKFYDPVGFFCRVINNKGGYYPSCAYINEARRCGVKILPPDVQLSDIGFSAIPHSEGSGRSGMALITGLTEIKNLSITTMKKTMRSRPFRTGESFFDLVRPSIDEAVALIRSGALDGFGKPWPELFFVFLNTRPAERALVEERPPDFHDFDQQKKTEEQLKTLGFLPGCHVLEIVCPQRRTRIADIKENRLTEIVGQLIARRTIYTKTKKLMSFLTLDDETGILEVVQFPDYYRQRTQSPILKVCGVFKDNSFVARDYITDYAAGHPAVNF